eukprot:3401825-Pleurochrysis_carterae.AAC.1
MAEGAQGWVDYFRMSIAFNRMIWQRSYVRYPWYNAIANLSQFRYVESEYRIRTTESKPSKNGIYHRNVESPSTFQEVRSVVIKVGAYEQN